MFYVMDDDKMQSGGDGVSDGAEFCASLEAFTVIR
jgi:hypothetical protein